MLKYEEEEIKMLIEKHKGENSEFTMYATRTLFAAEAYAA